MAGLATQQSGPTAFCHDKIKITGPFPEEHVDMDTVAETTASPHGGWKRVFACDLRSLAVMRVALGILLLVDLGMRSRSIEAMYSDAGFFPISAWQAHVQAMRDTTEPLSWSIHAWNGSLTFQAVLFLIATLAAGMLLLGWKTRLACIISWILLVSVQMRNPLVLHSGDCLFRLALFWGMFLPLGAVWSVDARRGNRDRPANPVVSGATVGLVLSLFSLYFFAGLAKLNDVWFSGQALEYVLKLDIYATGFGKFMLGWPGVLKWITWLTLVTEIVLPLLMLLPWKHEFWRYLAMVTFVALHVGIAACMSIGLFSPVAIAIWTGLLTTAFWERWPLRLASLRQDRASPGPSVTQIAGSRLANVFCLAMAAYFMLWNVATIDHPACRQAMPQQARVIGRYLNMRQAFRMFDVPPKHSPWFVYHARLENGEELDIFRNQPVTHERPKSVLRTIPQHHWRRLHRNLARPSFEKYREPVSAYMVRHWNATHGEDSQIVTERTTVYLEEIGSGSEPPGLVTQVWYQYGGDIAQQEMFDDLLKKMKDKGIILP
jgi:hypothetical protein